MSKIDPEMLDSVSNGSGWEVKHDSMGNPFAWKGPWLKDWFDNKPEALRANQLKFLEDRLAKEGKNIHGQTKEQARAFEERKKIQQIRKQKAEDALLASEKFSGGK